MAPKLAYWPVRGLAEPIRYLLHYTGTDFEDIRYTYGPEPDFYSLSEWMPVKFTLGLDFPNLPYYIDGDFRLTQSIAILRYLAKKHGLGGTTDEMIAKMETVEQHSVDVRTRFFYFCYDIIDKEEYLTHLPIQIKMFSEFLGAKKWLFGDKVTYVDFITYDALDFNRYVVSDFLDGFPNLKEYLKRFEDIPAISKYMKSEMYVKWPIVGPTAKFAGK